MPVEFKVGDIVRTTARFVGDFYTDMSRAPKSIYELRVGKKAQITRPALNGYYRIEILEGLEKGIIWDAYLKSVEPIILPVECGIEKGGVCEYCS